MRIKLGTTSTYRALDGKRYVEKAEITRETERAYLLEITRGPVVYKHWIPKSISLRLKTFIEVPDWFWEKTAEERSLSRAMSRNSRGGGELR